jgi:hypothetical protein
MGAAAPPKGLHQTPVNTLGGYSFLPCPGVVFVSRYGERRTIFVRPMLDFLDQKPFAASFVGVTALGTCYMAGLGDWRLVGLPLLAVLAYHVMIRDRA